MINKRIIVVLTSILLLALSGTCLAQGHAYFFTIYPSYSSVISPEPVRNSQVYVTKRNMLKPVTLAIGVNLTALPPAYNHMVKAWGAPDGKFHIKDDWAGDNLALNDEVSHLFVSYKLTQYLQSGYRMIGFSEKTSLIIGIVEAAFIVTAVEYPIDAYNPDQGLGISDLIFDYAGIGMAYFKITDSRFANWDLKTSVKSFTYENDNVFGSDNEDFDNYIYWLTYRKTPAVFGFGYGTSHPELGVRKVNKEFYLAVGTTIPDLLRPISKKLSDALRFTEFYYFNLKWNFLTLE
jgi:Predicted periplasmic lipoprotein (DUF2279)